MVPGADSDTPRPRRHWHRVAIVLVVIIFSVLLAWWKTEWNEVAARREIVERVMTAEGSVTFQHQSDEVGHFLPGFPSEPPPDPGPLRGLFLGPDSALRIKDVRFPNGVPVDTRALDLLQDLDEIRGLFLLGTLADDETLHSIGQLDSLRIVNLDSTNITQNGLRHLHGMPQLWGVALSRLRFSDEVFSHLEKLPRLRYVSLFETDVTEEGVENFRARHPGVEVEWSNPRDEAHRRALVRLDRAGFRITAERPGPDPDGQPTYTIHVSFIGPDNVIFAKPPVAFVWRGTPNDIRLLPQIPGVEAFSGVALSRAPLVTDDNIKAIGAMNSLKILNLSYSDLTDQGLIELAKLEHLHFLSLRHTAIGNDGMAHLAKIGTLSELNLSSTKVGDEGVKHLRSLPKLKVLVLSKTRITEDSVPVLGRFESLQELDVSGNDFSEDACRRLQMLLPECKVRSLSDPD